jgi:hypothetical protein
VGNGCCRLAHCCYPRRPREIGLRLLQRRLRQFPLGNGLSQLSVEGGKLFGSLCDTLLELLIQLCYFLFGLLESGRFDDLPVLVSLGDCALMGARHVKDVGRAGHRKRVGAQHRHRSAGHRPIELHFVFVKVSSNALVQPERIADDPQSFVPFGQRMSQFLIPNDSHPFSIEATVCEI